MRRARRRRPRRGCTCIDCTRRSAAAASHPRAGVEARRGVANKGRAAEAADAAGCPPPGALREWGGGADHRQRRVPAAPRGAGRAPRGAPRAPPPGGRVAPRRPTLRDGPRPTVSRRGSAAGGSPRRRSGRAGAAAWPHRAVDRRVSPPRQQNALPTHRPFFASPAGVRGNLPSALLDALKTHNLSWPGWSRRRGGAGQLARAPRCPPQKPNCRWEGC